MNSDLICQVELSRNFARDSIEAEKRKLAEQYFTPPRVAKIMSDMFSHRPGELLSVLDPCAGVGNLCAAICARVETHNEKLQFSLIEKDEFLAQEATRNFAKVTAAKVLKIDFFDYLVSTDKKFDRIIINPPYSKLTPESAISDVVKCVVGFRETNLYTAFIACCLTLLKPAGELVAIIPRSFCNGTTFRSFRNFLLERYSIHELYLFESRKIFADSGVQQETIVIKISAEKKDSVRVTHENASGKAFSSLVNLKKISFETDQNRFIHIPAIVDDELLLNNMACFKNNLISLGLRASTGKVVDFRSKRLLRAKHTPNTVTLLYQDAVAPGLLTKKGSSLAKKKRNIVVDSLSISMLVPRRNYLLVRRISFKEAPTRIVCAPLFERDFEKELIGIENHLNYIWGEKVEIDDALCRGLLGYLSTSSVDAFVRRFSGHTQINATDLNMLPTPSLTALKEFGLINALSNVQQLPELAERAFFSRTR